MPTIFEKWTPRTFPIVLAPLAGVSDSPFRRVCEALGADWTYVEMLSATALLYKSQRTLEMCFRNPNEKRLGVQVTGKTAQELADAIEILDQMPFDSIDINMGCPVKKIVAQGCGSAILQDVQKVFEYVSLARAKTSKPLSVKIRLGWDRPSINVKDVVRVIEEGGADWITIHGRCRSEDYSHAVDLFEIQNGCDATNLAVLGNGNLFVVDDLNKMRSYCKIKGVMISRGALGNPWVFKSMQEGKDYQPNLSEWVQIVRLHLDYQEELYGEDRSAAVCMRKHLLWYSKGWVGGKKLRLALTQIQSLEEARILLDQFAEEVLNSDQILRFALPTSGDNFQWEPKYEMDRQLDRGVGADL